ncbi:MAG TPA: hypothetical protein VLA04_03700 [Verrucomicrobiae bacterium]|nr:hypothetical protein [Verrucomicrobiae bacterium]
MSKPLNRTLLHSVLIALQLIALWVLWEIAYTQTLGTLGSVFISFLLVLTLTIQLIFLGIRYVVPRFAVEKQRFVALVCIVVSIALIPSVMLALFYLLSVVHGPFIVE